MNSKKKVVFGVAFVVFLVVLWFTTYFIWLQIKPENDKDVTVEQLVMYDESINTYTDATITVGDKEYLLKDLTKEVLGDTVVVNVKVNDIKTQGYVVFSDTVTEPKVELQDEESYAKVILPEEVSANE